MPTTVTLDADLELLLKEEARRSRRSFDEVLNDAVRRQLGGPAHVERFVVRSRDMGLKVDLDPAPLGELVGDLELESFLETTRRLERSVP